MTFVYVGIVPHTDWTLLSKRCSNATDTEPMPSVAPWGVDGPSGATTTFEESLLLQLREAELLAQRTTLQRKRALYVALHRCDSQLQELQGCGDSRKKGVEKPCLTSNQYTTTDGNRTPSEERLAAVVAAAATHCQEAMEVAARLSAARRFAHEEVLPFLEREGQLKSVLSMLLTMDA